ncbi:MAG: hypothetical protein HKM87_06500, partial [Ignavibacteriaceae bacterium]|nr:hypothetical protein [Ignavibacteriaceae bacterium]
LTTTLPDGSSTTTNFIECSGPIIPKGKIHNNFPVTSGGNGIQTINYGQVSYVCGSQLEVNNILVAWTVPSDSECPIVDANPHPKCGFQEGSLIIIPPLQATAEAFCTPENLIDLDAVGGLAPYSYEWEGPNGFTSTDEDLFEVAPGIYDVTITDSEGCSVSTSVTQFECCEFFATANLNSSEQIIEGCDVSDLPTPFTSPESVFTNITENPCGNLIMLQSDISSGNLCTGGLLVNRSYTLIDDLNNNNILDTGEEFLISDQNFRIIDTTLPTFNAPLPEDSTAAYNNIPSPTTLTASDNCDANPQVILNETFIGDNGSTTYTIVRTWTASDCTGNSTEHTQNIFVTENGDPIGLAINDVSLNESAGTATFTIALTGITSTNFTVEFASINGSAFAPGDYEAQSGTLPFIGTHGETQTIEVTINEDTIVESTEDYTIELSALSTTEIVINEAIGIGTILDNDAATVSINDIDVNENAGVINVQVVLNGDVEESFSIDFETANGSALAGIDYDNANGQVTFPSNATNGNIQNIAITINDDGIIEATENFLVDLSNISATGDVTITDNQANVNILDNDSTGTDGLSIVQTDVVVTEGVGVTAAFDVTLTGDYATGFDVD